MPLKIFITNTINIGSSLFPLAAASISKQSMAFFDPFAFLWTKAYVKQHGKEQVSSKKPKNKNKIKIKLRLKEKEGRDQENEYKVAFFFSPSPQTRQAIPRIRKVKIASNLK